MTSRMLLPRASLLLIAVGITAVAAANYNNEYGGYGRDDRNNDRNFPGGNANFPERRFPYQDQPYNNQNPTPYNPNPSNQQNPAYQQNSYSNNFNRNNNWENNRQNNNEYSRVYTKNETAIFCYINATKLDEQKKYYTGSQSLDTDSIDPRLCTHLVIGAAIINPNTYTVRLMNDDILTRQGNGFLSFDKISELRRDNPNLKVLLSISGNSVVFANMAASHRDVFIKSITDICRDKNVGVNIDWQWPERRRGSDVENYFQFLMELKSNLRPLATTSHDLTVSLPAEQQYLTDILQPRNDRKHTMETMLMEYVDYFILMAFELRGHFDQKIEHHAPIDSYIGGRQTVRRAINEVRGYVPREYLYKFILAIPFYGKRYQLAARAERESPMNKLQQQLHSSYDYDSLIRIPYHKICQEVAGNEFQHDYDETNGAPYAYHDNIVFVYEDTRSVKAKTRLAIQNGFGGVMAYSIEMDDATGNCRNRRSSYDSKNSYNSYSSNSESRFPLLNAIKDQVQRGNAAQFHSSPLAIALAVICAFILKVNN